MQQNGRWPRYILIIVSILLQRAEDQGLLGVDELNHLISLDLSVGAKVAVLNEPGADVAVFPATPYSIDCVRVVVTMIRILVNYNQT